MNRRCMDVLKRPPARESVGHSVVNGLPIDRRQKGGAGQGAGFATPKRTRPQTAPLFATGVANPAPWETRATSFAVGPLRWPHGHTAQPHGHTILPHPRNGFATRPHRATARPHRATARPHRVGRVAEPRDRTATTRSRTATRSSRMATRCSRAAIPCYRTVTASCRKGAASGAVVRPSRSVTVAPGCRSSEKNTSNRSFPVLVTATAPGSSAVSVNSS